MSFSAFSTMSLGDASRSLKAMASHRPGYEVTPPRPVWTTFRPQSGLSESPSPCLAFVSRVGKPDGSSKHTCVIGVRPLEASIVCAMWCGDAALTGKLKGADYQQSIVEALEGFHPGTRTRMIDRRDNLAVLGEQLQAGYGIFDHDTGCNFWSQAPKGKTCKHLEIMANFCERKMGGVDAMLRALAYEAADTLCSESRGDAIKAVADRSLGIR